MTTYTNSDWVTHILRKSSIVGEDENPTAAQSDEAQRIINSGVAFLAIDGITMWNGSQDVVPEEWFDVGADYMALYIRQGFGGPPPGQDEVRAAMYPLRKLSAKPVRPWQKTTCISK